MAFTKEENGITVHVSPIPFDVNQVFRGNIAEYMLTTEGLAYSADPDFKVFIDCHDSSNFVSVRRYRDLIGKINHVLVHKYGFNRGDVVCLFLTNTIFHSPLHLGIFAAGGIVTPANIFFEPKELNSQIDMAGAKYVITQDKFTSIVNEACTSPNLKPVNVKHVIDINTLIKEAEAPNVPWDRPVHLTPEEALTTHAYYCFSSGTSGVPKGVITSHFNIVANVVQQLPVTRKTYKNSVSNAVVPMSHIYGITKFVYVIPALGNNKIVVFDKFDLQLFLEKSAEHGTSVFHIVPPIAVLFAKHPLVDKYPEIKKNIKTILCGAAPLSTAMLKKLKKRLNNVHIIQGYGLTETSPMNLMGPGPDDETPAPYDNESCGWAMPGVDFRLVNTDDGSNISGFGPENRGEIWLRGPHIMQGYLNNPEANKQTFDSTGQWLKTGDVGVVSEDGQWYIVDRVKELIKSNGHQVAPAELEDIILQHPDVVDACVAGITVPEEGTEMPRAFVVLNNKNADPLEIKRWFDSKVARHKKLWGGIVVLDAIPKTTSGKIQRRFLRDRTGDKVFGFKLDGAIKPKL